MKMDIRCIGIAAALLPASGVLSQGNDGFPCRLCADVNGDGVVSSADFNAWIIANNNGDLVADQNRDGLLTPADFSAFIANQNQGTNGPVCPGYSVGCPGPGKFIAGSFLTPSAVLPIALASIDGSPSALVETPRGDIVDFELFDIDAVPNVVLEDRFVAGDDPARSPLPGEVVLVREEYRMAALHVIDESGKDVYASALIVRSSFSVEDNTTGAVLQSRVDVYDRIQYVGRYQSFADALTDTMEISSRLDTQLENPDPINYPQFGTTFDILPVPGDYVVNIDTGTVTPPTGLLIDCGDPNLSCVDQAGCLYNDCSRGCISQLTGDMIESGLGIGGAALGGCLTGVKFCGLSIIAAPAVKACCAFGAGYGAIITGFALFNQDFTTAQNCHSGCRRDFIRDLGDCP